MRPRPRHRWRTISVGGRRHLNHSIIQTRRMLSRLTGSSLRVLARPRAAPLASFLRYGSSQTIRSTAAHRPSGSHAQQLEDRTRAARRGEHRSSVARNHEETERTERFQWAADAPHPWTLRLDRGAPGADDSADDSTATIHLSRIRGPRVAPDKSHLVQRRAREGQHRKAPASYDE